MSSALQAKLLICYTHVTPEFPAVLAAALTPNPLTILHFWSCHSQVQKSLLREFGFRLGYLRDSSPA